MVARAWDGAQRAVTGRGTTGPIRLGLHHAVGDLLGGTVTTLSIDGPAFLPLLYAPVAEVALRRLVRP